MASRHTLFRIFYAIGFTPWDGHAHTKALRELIEGTADTPGLPPAAALDVGCGTGDSSVYLAQHGWHVTAVDFVPKALDKARAKARAADVSMLRIRPCATELRRITACSMRSSARSSVYWPRPRRKRKSSSRSIGLPMKALVARRAVGTVI